MKEKTRRYFKGMVMLRGGGVRYYAISASTYYAARIVLAQSVIKHHGVGSDLTMQLDEIKRDAFDELRLHTKARVIGVLTDPDTQSTDEYHLPDTLGRGETLLTKSQLVTVLRTTKRDEYGERLYRLRYASGVVGQSLWSRDHLDEMGCIVMGA